MKDLKYFLSYTIPLSALIGIQVGGIWTFTTVFYAFGFIPIWEALITPSSEKLSEEQIEHRLANRFFDGMLYFNILIVYGMLFYGLYYLSSYEAGLLERLGLVLSIGIVLGTNGINVAHELGHRKTVWERMLAKFLLLPALYMHFYIEHNFGHHKNVGTPEDPATSKLNQTVFSFWYTSIIGQFINAVRIQKRLLKKTNRGFFSLHNDLFYYQLFQLSYLVIIGLFFGLQGVFYAVSIALVSVVLLETINYIEHYGLQRAKKRHSF